MEKIVLSKNEIVVFNSAKAAVSDAVQKLKPMVFTEKRGRDGLFNACVEANQVKTQIGNRRLDITRPMDAKKKEIKGLFDELTADLEKVLSEKRQLIASFDYEEKKKAEAAARKLEAQRLLKEREEKEKLEAAEKLSGIAKAKSEAKIRAEAEARDEKFRAEQEKIQNQTALKGSKKTEIEFQLVDINQVPEEYTKKEVDWWKVKDAASKGVREIPGFRMVEKQGVVFSGRA